MSDTTTAKQMPQDRDALFSGIMSAVKPEDVRALSLAERLAPWRPTLLKHRRKGYSVTQLAAGLARPEIGIEVTPRALRTYLAIHRKPTAVTPRAQTEDTSKASAKTR